MMLLSILGLSLTDVIAGCVPLIGGIFAFVKYLEATKEKHKLDKQSELDKEKLKCEAEVEKEKIRVQGEVEKAKERSVGGEAITKIWKEVEELKHDIDKLEDTQADELTNRVVMKEIIEKIKYEYDRLVKLLWDKFLNIPS